MVDNDGDNLYVNDDEEDINKGNSAFWLRTPGELQIMASFIRTSVRLNNSGNNVDDTIYGVRPTLWVKY